MPCPRAEILKPLHRTVRAEKLEHGNAMDYAALEVRVLSTLPRGSNVVPFWL